jgi:hypothetical protein
MFKNEKELEKRLDNLGIKIDLTMVHLNWCTDIFKRIQTVLESDSTEESKLEQIKWYVKQGLKVERED